MGLLPVGDMGLCLHAEDWYEVDNIPYHNEEQFSKNDKP